MGLGVIPSHLVKVATGNSRKNESGRGSIRYGQRKFDVGKGKIVCVVE